MMRLNSWQAGVKKIAIHFQKPEFLERLRLLS